MYGAPCVMTYGIVMMPLLCVESWDTPLKVSNWLKVNCTERDAYIKINELHLSKLELDTCNKFS